MKRIFPILLFLLLASSLSVFAQEEQQGWMESSLLPETHIQTEVHLLASQSALEERILTAWDSLAAEIDVADLDIAVTELEKMYMQVLYDNPMYYYVKSAWGYSYIGGTVIKITPVYTETDPDAIAAMQADLNEATNEILMHINGNMTDFEKVMTVHDYMVLNYHYDLSYSNYSISIMTTKTGVCMAYAFAFNHLMDQLGIESTYVSSPEEYMNHAWNLVKIDGEWYHIDLTSDDPVSAGTTAKSEDSGFFAQVRHTYALLSSSAIRSLGHYGFDLGYAVADSTLYDNASWRDSQSAIVHSHGMSYWIEDDDLVREDGRKIFKNLDGGDGKWYIGTDGKYLYNFNGYIGAGLAEYNGLLYFNTDQAIYTYDPQTGKDPIIYEEQKGICGLFIEKNQLRYSKYDRDARLYVDGGSVALKEAQFTEPYIDEAAHKVVTRVHNENQKPVKVFAFGGGRCQCAEVGAGEYATVTFDADGSQTQTIFYWTDQLKPLRPKEVITVS